MDAFSWYLLVCEIYIGAVGIVIVGAAAAVLVGIYKDIKGMNSWKRL